MLYESYHSDEQTFVRLIKDISKISYVVTYGFRLYKRRHDLAFKNPELQTCKWIGHMGVDSEEVLQGARINDDAEGCRRKFGCRGICDQ